MTRPEPKVHRLSPRLRAARCQQLKQAFYDGERLAATTPPPVRVIDLEVMLKTSVGGWRACRGIEALEAAFAPDGFAVVPFGAHPADMQHREGYPFDPPESRPFALGVSS